MTTRPRTAAMSTVAPSRAERRNSGGNADPLSGAARSIRRRSRRTSRELHREGRALSGLALHRDSPSVGLDDLARDVEPQAKAAEVSRRDRALEAVEDPADV